MTCKGVKVAIVTDSTSDIPQDLAEEYNIHVVPAIITMGDQSYRDGVDLTREEFYELLGSTEETLSTGASSPQLFQDAYEKALSSGCEHILSVHVAAKLSGILNAAHQGAQALGEKVSFLDSEQVSFGLAYQVLSAARIACENAPLDRVVRAAEETRKKVRNIVMIDTLDFLQRSGRVGWLGANLGKMLNIKLLVEVTEGVIERVGQVRTRGKAIEEVLDHVKAWGPLEEIAIGHSAIHEQAESLKEKITQWQGDLLPRIFQTTPAIGVHTGPGALGVFGKLK